LAAITGTAEKTSQNWMTRGLIRKKARSWKVCHARGSPRENAETRRVDRWWRRAREVLEEQVCNHREQREHPGQGQARESATPFGVPRALAHDRDRWRPAWSERWMNRASQSRQR
jgi:hypothetical protein